MGKNICVNEKSDFCGNTSWMRVIIGSTLLFLGFLIIDIHNIPSVILYKYKMGSLFFVGEDIVIIIIACIVILGTLIYKSRVFSLLKMPCSNIFDETIIMIMIACLAIMTAECGLGILCDYKVNWLYSVFIASGLFVAFRWNFFINVSGTESKNEIGIVDLRDFLSEDFKAEKKPILFSEEAVDYDLLNRDGIVTLVTDSIERSNSKHVFTIGLCGPWGCGKTTIINLVKACLAAKTKNVAVVDDFDPWMYGTKEAMLGALYEVILKNTGIQFSFLKGKRIANSLFNTVADNFKMPRLSVLSKEWGDDDVSVKYLKRQIGTYLNRKNRKIVIFIDNLDRAESSNILFLFKVIGSVLDLPNIVYVLAYDKDRVTGVFQKTNAANSNYLEKIVQQEINISQLSELPLRQVTRSCVLKAIHEYSEKELAIEYEEVTNAISQNIVSLRQLKRLLNSVFVSTFCHENSLYKPHLLAIETIRFLEKGLYDAIWLNSRFFISRDIGYDFKARFLNSENDSFNEEARSFFDDLLKRYRGFKDLLASLFPNVGRYILNEDLTVEYADAPIHSTVASIASSKYFKLYFSYDSNYYLDVINSVGEFINTINRMEENIDSYIAGTFNIIPSNEQYDWLLQLQEKVAEIDESKRYSVAMNLQESINRMDESRQFGRPSISQRAIAVLTKLLLLIGKGELTEEVVDIIEKISAEYNFYELKEIVTWCDYFYKRGDGDYSKIEKYSNSKFNDVCSIIVNDKIDIYNDKLFHVENTRYLNAFFGEEEDGLKEFISSIVDEKNVIKIIRNMIIESIINGEYKYTLKKVNVNLFVTDPYIITQKLQCVKCETADKKVISQLWVELYLGREEHDEVNVILGHRLGY